MLILTELVAGDILMRGGTPYIRHSKNEFFDKKPGDSMKFLEETFDTLAAREPEKTFAIIKVRYDILKRNHEPVSPCGR